MSAVSFYDKGSKIAIVPLGDDKGIIRVASIVIKDIERVSGSERKVCRIAVTEDLTSGKIAYADTVVFAGILTGAENCLTDRLLAKTTVSSGDILGRREVYAFAEVTGIPELAGKRVFVIAGSDKLGTIYGLYKLSEMIGVSPWHYFGDVEPAKCEHIAFEDGVLPIVSREPKIEYRGFFLNDDWPSLGGWVTNRFVAPKLEKLSWSVPEEMAGEKFAVSREEVRDLKWALLGLVVAACVILPLGLGPLKGHFAKNVILFVSFAFFMAGLFYGVRRGKYRAAQDVVAAMTRQVKELGYMFVLTFFCFNFLALLTYSGVGAYITYAGVKAIFALNLASSPVLLLAAFILMGSFVNLFVASLSAKWLMLGPIFIPMLYHVNPSLTPEVVCAAYRTADPCTNIVTPVMTYAGVILLSCRRYRPQFTIGDLALMMTPYAGVFLVVATTVMLLWFKLGIPFGF